MRDLTFQKIVIMLLLAILYRAAWGSSSGKLLDTEKEVDQIAHDWLKEASK